ncbi:Uncharacterised protein [Mycobacterium tuberculosis]|nr:Uncharacterised protein [Mycobacterium tuberculosis]
MFSLFIKKVKTYFHIIWQNGLVLIQVMVSLFGIQMMELKANFYTMAVAQRTK